MSALKAEDLRARLAARRARLLERARRAGDRGERGRRRWRRWWLVILALLLLLLLRDCRCEHEVVEAPAAPPEAGPAGVVEAAEVASPLPKGRLKRRDRPGFVVESPDPLPWIDALRLQVAARGPRLAACFVGAARPGALRWTAAVDPTSGRVSDQALEPTLTSEPLTRAQRDCALEVLSEPVYRLEPGEGPATPARVGLVVEF